MSLWEDIEKDLPAHGLSPECFYSFREFIYPPPDLCELPRVLENFPHLFRQLDTILPFYSEDLTRLLDPGWLQICNFILSHPEFVSRADLLRKKGTMPLGGYYDDHQVYVAIWTIPESTADYWNYFAILAHVCIATINLRSWMQEQINEELSPEKMDDFNYRIKRALQTTRMLAKKHLLILRALPNLAVSPDKLLDIFEQHNLLNEEISPLFKFLLEIRKSSHRKSVDKYPVPFQLRAPAHVVEIEENFDYEQIVSSIEIRQQLTQSEEYIEEAVSVGCAPDESFSGVEIASQDTYEKKIKSPTQKANLKRSVKSKIVMQNQMLPGRWETLTSHEVSSFLAAVSDLINKRASSPYLPKAADPDGLAAFLTIMFWCGQRIEKAIYFWCYMGGVPSNATEPGFVSSGELEGYWWAVPAVPDRKIFPDKKQLTKVHPTVDAYQLFSGVVDNERVVSAYVHNVHRGSSNSLFPLPQKYYEEMVRSFLSRVNSRHKCRLTSNRVSDYLFNSIARQNGSELVTAMYITGRDHFLGHNLSHYTAISVLKLQRCYRQVCGEIARRHFLECHHDEAKISFQPGNIAESIDYVGSPFTPTRETVNNLVIELKMKLKDSMKTRPSIFKLMRVHKYMTRYTAFMIGFCTGFRAVSDPFLSASEIDWKSGFAILSDKDNEDRFNSRLIWIPPVCLEQIRLFREHTHNALYRFSILIPDLYSKLKSPRRKGPGRYMFFAQENVETGVFDTLNFRPSDFNRQLEVYPLPFNSSRHYLRSNLLYEGCPPEVVNAFMGHFERGEEPWGIFSGLSPLDYREALQRYLVPLIETAKWEALSGIGSAL